MIFVFTSIVQFCFLARGTKVSKINICVKKPSLSPNYFLVCFRIILTSESPQKAQIESSILPQITPGQGNFPTFFLNPPLTLLKFQFVNLREDSEPGGIYLVTHPQERLIKSKHLGSENLFSLETRLLQCRLRGRMMED